MSLVPHHFHYFSHHVNREVREVYWQAFLANLAIAMAFIFEPIYLLSLGVSPSQILLFYGQVYFWYAILVFLAANIISRIGYKHSIAISNAFYVLYWLLLFLIPNFEWLLFVAPVFYALQKSLYWPAFNADVAINSEKNQRGREVGVLFSLLESAVIIGPFLGGAIVYQFGFAALFFVSSLFILASVFPLFNSPEIFTKHKFRFKNFVAIFRKYRLNFLGYWGYAEDFMLMTLWPLVVFGALSNFFGVGLITAVASSISIVLMLIMGKVADKLPNRLIIQVASFFYALTWIFRFLAGNAYKVLAFDALTRTFKGMVNVPMVSLTYELAGTNGPDRAIAYAVFYEFSLSIGKVVTALLGILILSYTGNINYVFMLAGFFTLFYGLLRK